MHLQKHYPLLPRIREEQTFRTPRNIFLKLLIFLAVFIVGEMLSGMVIVIAAMPSLMQWASDEMQVSGGSLDSELANEQINSIMNNASNVRVMLFSTVLTTAAVLFFCRIIEGRRFRTMSFRKQGAVVQYLLGLLVGFVLFTALIGLGLVFGGLRFDGVMLESGSVPAVIVMFCGYLLQGMSEEVMCRGYLMTTIMRHRGPVWGILINSVVFSLLHLENPGFGILAFLNITLFGVLESLYVLRTDNLWGACAVHSIWNFVQGNFYGLPVSGLDSGARIFGMSLQGSTLVNGGTFGLEGSIGCTIVTVVAIAVLLFVPFGRQNKEQQPAPAEAAA